MTAPTRKVRLADMLRAGVRAVTDYTGTVLGLFVVQLVIAAGVGLTFSFILSSELASRPLFDEGVDGDLAALIEVLRSAPAVFGAIGWIGLGAVILWVMLTWFLFGGLVGVLHERPHGRRETARVFGASGAATFLVLLRLALVSLLLHGAVVIAFVLGVGAVYPRIEHALTIGPVIGWLLVGLAPGLLLLAFLWTVIDYARIELVIRRPTHERLGALVAFARAVVFVVGKPLALAHVLLWGLAFVVVSVLYVWASHDAAMLGTGGAVALLIVRQGLSLLRMALKVVLVGGQLELAVTRAPPARRAQVDE